MAPGLSGVEIVIEHLTAIDIKTLRRMLKTYRELLPKDHYSTRTSEMVQAIEDELKARGVKSDKQTAL